MNKGFSTTLGIIIGLLVIGGGVYYFISIDKTENILKNTNTDNEELDASENHSDKIRIGETMEEQTARRENTEMEYNKLSQLLQTGEIFEYSELYVTKYGSDVYLLDMFSFENEYSGGVYHIDLIKNDITKIDSPYIYKENGKMYGLKMYDVDYDTSMDGQNEQYTLNESRLEEVSNEVGIKRDDLTIQAFGGKPVFRVLVSTEYNPVTKEIKLLPNKKPDYPSYCYPKYCPNYEDSFFVLNNEKYPSDDFVSLGSLIEMNGVFKQAFGLEFNYNLGTKRLSIQ